MRNNVTTQDRVCYGAPRKKIRRPCFWCLPPPPAPLILTGATYPWRCRSPPAGWTVHPQANAGAPRSGSRGPARSPFSQNLAGRGSLPGPMHARKNVWRVKTGLFYHEFCSSSFQSHCNIKGSPRLHGANTTLCLIFFAMGG